MNRSRNWPIFSMWTRSEPRGHGVPAPQLCERSGCPFPATPGSAGQRGADTAVALRKEKLSPVTLVYTYATFDEALGIAKCNILLQGGAIRWLSTLTIRSISKLWQMAIPVTRVIVNQCATTSAGGSFMNGFGATTTLERDFGAIPPSREIWTSHTC